ncbi:MAG: GntR family transcriptional regulator [Oscillospiraceae bacterium]|nr:GntR family transcriptional regulator [Oscillospiraceae bacterium]
MKIQQNSGEPIYRQIERQFREQIISGKLAAGEYLPSIRSLASDLRISVITTMKAYDELAKDGLVTSVAGKGYYVNSQNAEMLKEQQMRELENNLLAAIQCARNADLTDTDLIEILKTLLNAEV